MDNSKVSLKEKRRGNPPFYLFTIKNPNNLSNVQKKIKVNLEVILKFSTHFTIIRPTNYIVGEVNEM